MRENESIVMKWNGIPINNVSYADDKTCLAENLYDLQKLLTTIAEKNMAQHYT